jgi:hypothetical protein
VIELKTMNKILEFLANHFDIKKNSLAEKKSPRVGGLVKIIFLNSSSLYNTNTLSLFTNAFKLHNACGERKECVITADTDVDAGMKLCTSLTHKDVSGKNNLTAKTFNPKPLGIAVAAVPRTSTAFFMSHTTSPV